MLSRYRQECRWTPKVKNQSPSWSIRSGRAGFLASWLVTINMDLVGVFAHGVAVVPCLHAQQRIQRYAKSFFNSQGHFRGEGSFAVHKIGERRPPYAENVGSSGNGQAKLIQYFHADEVTRMRGLHANFYRLVAHQW